MATIIFPTDTADKATPVGADLFMLADSADSNALKEASLTNMASVINNLDTARVTAGANITDHAIVRGDGGAKGVQDSNVLIDDSDNITGANSFKFSDTSAPSPSDNILYSLATSKLHRGAGEVQAYEGRVVIRSMDDFPAAVGGVITLEQKRYVIDGIFTTDLRFNCPDGTQTGFDSATSAFTSGFIYTGDQAFISGDGGFASRGIFFSQTHASGQLLDLTPATTKTLTVFFDQCVFSDIVDLGDVTNQGTFVVLGSAIVNVGQGFNLTNISGIFGHFNQWQSGKDAGGTAFSINGTSTRILFTSMSFTPEATEFVFDFDSALTTNVGSISSVVVDLGQGGSVFASGSLDQSEVEWKYTGNVNIQDTKPLAQMNLKGNTTVTTFTAVNTPAPVLGTWTDGSEHFTTTAAGRATYNGLEDINLPIIANPTAVLDTGTNKDVTFAFGHGNLTNHGITAFADAGGGQVTVTTSSVGISRHTLIAGDYVIIENTTNYNGYYQVANVTATTFEITETFAGDDATGDWINILPGTDAGNQLASTTKASNTCVLGRYEFVTGDFIQLYAENNTDGTGIVVKECSVLIN